jgi:hypothetical protein
MFRDISRGSSAHTVPPTNLTLDEQLPIRLRDHAQRLRLILPVLSVAVLALKSQGADFDEDIASVLHRHAIDPLDVEVDKIDALLESLATARRAEEAE